MKNKTGRKNCSNGETRLNCKRLGLPMHEDAPSIVQSFLDELICSREMLEQVFVLYIVHLHCHVLVVRSEEVLVQGHAQYGDDMGDICLLKR